MNSRMNKYYEQAPNKERTKRNQELYQEIKVAELDNFNLNSNVSVLGDNTPQIDVEKVREMLDVKYNEIPKRKSIPVALEEELVEELDITKDYDINTVLQKAHSEKVSDYETDRLKKLRDTQYNILKNLDLEPQEEKKEISEEEKRLLNLINTITEKELAKKDEMDPLDILTDLKGNDEVTEPVEKENTITQPPIDEQMIKEVVQEEVQNQIDKSFYTTQTSFSAEDFEDFNDLKEDVRSSKTLIQILIILILIILIVGIVFLLNTFFNLNLFLN